MKKGDCVTGSTISGETDGTDCKLEVAVQEGSKIKWFIFKVW